MIKIPRKRKKALKSMIVRISKYQCPCKPGDIKIKSLTPLLVEWITFGCYYATSPYVKKNSIHPRPGDPRFIPQQK